MDTYTKGTEGQTSLSEVQPSDPKDATPSANPNAPKSNGSIIKVGNGKDGW